MWQDIRTGKQVLRVLGGAEAVSQMFHPRLNSNAVENWGRRGVPAKAYCVIAQALVDAGCRFDPERLFGMLKPRGDNDGRTKTD